MYQLESDVWLQVVHGLLAGVYWSGVVVRAFRLLRGIVGCSSLHSCDATVLRDGYSAAQPAAFLSRCNTMNMLLLGVTHAVCY